MERKNYKDRQIDRSSWKLGGWNDEPDFYEWTTNVEYSVWCSRLPSGAWFAIIEAPYPIDEDIPIRMGSHHCIRDKAKGKLEFQPGMTFPTEKKDISGFAISFEDWESP